MVDSAEKILNIISVLKKFSPTDKDMGYLEKLYDRQHRSGGGGGRGDGGSRRGGGRVSKFQQPKSRPIHKPVSKTKGQGRNKQAMKIVNMVKLKEEFDFESLCWKLEGQVDHLSAEIEREQKLREHGKCDLEKGLKQCQVALADARKSQVTRHELKEMGNQAYQEALADTTQLYEKKIAGLMKQLEDEHARCEAAEEQLDLANKLLTDQQNSMQKLQEIDELRMKLQEMYHQHEGTLTELQPLKAEHENLLQEKATLIEELYNAKQRLSVEEKQRKSIEYELTKLKRGAPDNENYYEDKKLYMKENIGLGSSAFENSMSLHKSSSRTTLSSQRATIAKICEEVGIQKILQLLRSEDSEVQTHAVKVIANLAAEDINQEKIVEEGGLDALLMLLRSSHNTTILRVAAGAIANLAMNELNQGLIMSKGGAQLLAKTASRTDDPQTLRMVAGALANLCGNERLHTMLKEDGGIKALLDIAGSGNTDVIAQVARGLANFAKCESRGILQGNRRGRSLLIEDGGLEWLIANSNSTSSSTRRHVELALCHLAQNEDNVGDFISLGAIEEIVRISVESNREDIRNLAKKTLRNSSAFQGEVHP